VILANELTIEIDGLLDASGCGYKGGSISCQGESWTGPGIKERAANGGGGGGSETADSFQIGGGGGGFATEGSCSSAILNGDKYLPFVGRGGQKYDPFAKIPQTLLGSAGGGGCLVSLFDHLAAKGGEGGGAIILRVHTLRNNGSIRARGHGGAFSREAGGGGGSGGLVLIVADRVFGAGSIRAVGGDGGSSPTSAKSFSAGGSGGDGVILIRSPDAFSVSSGAINCNPLFKLENNLDFPDLGPLISRV
jgi:hypothetical protein